MSHDLASALFMSKAVSALAIDHAAGAVSYQCPGDACTISPALKVSSCCWEALS